MLTNQDTQRLGAADLVTSIQRSEDAAIRSAALTYAGQGWFLVPLHGVTEQGDCRCPSGGRCGSAGKHPIARLAPHGWRDASRYPPTVDLWWRMCPAANIGVVTGPSQLASLDIDPRNGGNESLRLLVSEFGELPETLHLLTGGGGEHFIFADPDREVRKRTPLPGIDVLGGGCLFVAPPSVHRSGVRYRWEDERAPLALAPSWLAGGAR